MWVSSWVIALQAAVFFLILAAARSQKTSRATTAVAEAKALNSIFEEWKISANTKQWNTTGDPCSGVALGTSPTMDDTTYDPFIKCDCSDNNGTTCHIIALKVYALDVVGVLPDELWSLTFLQNLKLGQNYLTGPISPSIGNLTQLQYLDFGINALSGELPKELGGLKNLISLGLGANNFSGSLPSELGSLTNLQQLYIDSSGVSGVIPSTFADLQSLQTVWASDVKFTGSIPDFIGNWTQLITLRLEGNSFSGSIPSKFSTLTSLQELRISDISNGSSSLSFVNNLKSLTNLVLRNNNITGPIPSALGELQSLGHLDLSFNNLAGEIPESIFNIGSLSYLFLGNNKLTGNLPVRKSTTLLNIDVSYNELSGSLPTWINDKSLQLNLVANNFSMSNSPGSVLPGGLNCLQRNFPCNGGLGRYYSFAVKCGGPQITSADQVTYERDNQTLGPATYFVIDTDRWAVSNVGLPTSNNNRTYTIFSPHQFTSTLDSELFQTARLSAGSLRYYGLGLENGNYTVLLQFAEIQIENGKTWRALGKRIFDILIQGNVVAKDFDIRKEAGNQSFKAVKKTFTAQVTSNHLEIHLFWAGKGTCCIPQQGVYGPSISAISVTPNFPPKVSNKPPSKNKSHTGLILGIVIPVGILGILSLAACWFIQRKKRSQGTEELLGMDNKPFTFAYAELRSATGDFDSSNKLGEGGFGPVFKGTLNDGRVVAVKQLSVASHQGQNQFIAEIATISAVQHRNLVKLYGCCINGEKRLLVYEYLENKSLDQALFGKSNLELNWGKRFDICMGVARGLAYLHEESRLRIVHRDVKASNILLDSDLNPKISDFGLAKLYDDKKTHISTRVAGTIGYLAPEYAMRGHLTEKVDVFGFGVVALEIVSGRPNSDTGLDKEKAYLLEWAWHLHENNRLIELVDARLSEFNEDEVKQVIRVALLCTQTSPTQRPTMSRVVAMLAGDIEVEAVISKPGYLADWSFDDASFMGGDASTSNYGYSSTSKSTGTNAVNSPADVTLSMVSDTVGSGR